MTNKYHKQGLQPVEDPDSRIVGYLMKKDRMARKTHAKAVAKPEDAVISLSKVASDEAEAEPGVHEESAGPESKGKAGTKLEEPKKNTRAHWFIRTKTYVT